MNLEEEIVSLYSDNLRAAFSINEIAKKLKKPYATIHNMVQDLSKKRIIKKQQKGKALLCTLNLSHERVKALLSSWSINYKEKFEAENPILIKSLTEVVARLQKSLKHNLLSLVLFGSLARDRGTKRSDVDILVIVPDKKESDDLIHKECSRLEVRYGKVVNPIIVTPEIFINMIKSDKENVGKEVLKSKVIFFGFEKFWELVMEGTK